MGGLIAIDELIDVKVNGGSPWIISFWVDILLLG